ncbi:MAG TPA: DMT family transporter [Nitriliruptorales bacterium]|nr:DMT family transporter [Nitriliruptorales bacterium]
MALVAVTFVWGATFVVVQEAVERLAVFPFNAWRFAIAATTLGVAVRGQLPHLGRRGLRRGVLLGTALWAGYALQTFGLTLTTAPKAAFITGMVVVITPLLQAPILRQVPAGPAVTGAVMAAVGLGLLTLHGSLVPAAGDLLVLGCAVAFVLHLIGLGAWSSAHPVGALATVQLATAALLHATGGTVRDAAIGAASAWWTGSPYVWAAIGFTAVFATALAFFAQTAAQRVLSPTRTAVVFTLEPVFAWLTAWLGVPLLAAAGIRGLSAATFGAREAAGAALILVGMLWSELRGGEAPDALAAEETAALGTAEGSGRSPAPNKGDGTRRRSLSEVPRVRRGRGRRRAPPSRSGPPR